MKAYATDQQIDTIRDKILLLVGKTESAVARAVKALTTRDSELAERVRRDDERVRNQYPGGLSHHR